MKSVFLASTILCSTMNPIVSDQVINDRLTSLSNDSVNLNYNNEIYNNFKEIINSDKDNFKNLVSSFYNELNSKNGIESNTLSELTNFQNKLIGSDNKNNENKSWTQWRHLSLWINLTKKETDRYLEVLYPYRNVSNFFDFVSNGLNQSSTNLGEISSQLGGNPMGYVLEIWGSMSFLGSVILKGFNDFFNYHLIQSLANKGYGVVSFQMLFGIFYMGIHPGYKVV